MRGSDPWIPACWRVWSPSSYHLQSLAFEVAEDIGVAYREVGRWKARGDWELDLKLHIVLLPTSSWQELSHKRSASLNESRQLLPETVLPWSGNLIPELERRSLALQERRTPVLAPTWPFLVVQVLKCLYLSCKNLNALLTLLNKHLLSDSHVPSKSESSWLWSEIAVQSESFAVCQTGPLALCSGSDPTLYPTMMCDVDLPCADLGTKG